MNIDYIAEELETQDNLFTQDPLFSVYEKIKVPTKDGITDDFTYVDGPNDSNEYADMAALRVELVSRGADLTDLDDWEVEDLAETKFEMDKVYWLKQKRFVTACLTRKGAEAYIRANGHNLNKPFIYVDSLYRNEEMRAVRKLLVELKPVNT